jgi:hypothetical protein
MDSYVVYALTTQGIFRGKSSLSFFSVQEGKPHIHEIHATSFGLYGVGLDKRLYIAEIAGKSLWSWELVDKITGNIDSADTAQSGTVLYLQRGRQVTRYTVTTEGLSQDTTITVNKGRFYISPSESKYAVLYRQQATVFSQSGKELSTTAARAIDFDSNDKLRAVNAPRYLQLFLSPSNEEYSILTGACQ